MPRGIVNNSECLCYGAGDDRSVASLSQFVVRLAADRAGRGSIFAGECGGKGTLRGVTDARGDLAHRQPCAQQQRPALMQAAQPDEFLWRLPGFTGEARVETRHGKAGQSCQVPDLERMGQMSVDVLAKRGQR